MPDCLQFSLQNQSDSDQVYAYVVGLALQHGGQRCLIKANGKDLYFPENPPAIGSPLAEDCAIPLGPPGNTVNITVPQLAGGRLWFSKGEKLTFLLNPGPALVEPSVLNPSDPNAKVNFAFCEFTLNNDQFYGNISYVDFVPQLPIAISLKNKEGAVESVAGMASDGIDKIAQGLREQAKRDGKPWDKLIVEHEGRPFRILNATHGNAVGADFSGYFEAHVEEVWSKYRQHHSHGCMKLNTQAAPGTVDGYINDKDELVIGGEIFCKPTTADILGCNSGPFTTGPSPTRNAIIPRLAAAFVRTTLLDCHDCPSHPHTYYKRDPTNHYARVVHECNLDGKGYAFAYDDVQPDGGDDQSGKVNDGAPVLFTAVVGGLAAGSKDQHHQNSQPQPLQPMTAAVPMGKQQQNPQAHTLQPMSAAVPLNASSTSGVPPAAEHQGGLRGKLHSWKEKFSK